MTAHQTSSSNVDVWFGDVHTPEMALTSLTFHLQSNTQSWARPSSLTSLASTTPRKDAASKMKTEKHQRKVTHLKELPKNTAVSFFVCNKSSYSPIFLLAKTIKYFTLFAFRLFMETENIAHVGTCTYRFKTSA